MLNLESSLKKKTLIKPRVVRGKRKKAFVRVKKNKAYRLFGSRSFNIWRSHLRFTLKLKLLKIKFQLIEKLLLRNFKMNKHFFKKRSTLSYVKKLKSHSYLVKCRKNIRFFFIIERRLLVVLARLYITRIVAQDQLKFLILNGYISVDNEIVKNPYYLAPHKAIIRILKTIPRSLSKVPKTLITINLRWLYFKRCRKLKRKMWRVKGRRRP
jgi:ribosomal protein S4